MRHTLRRNDATRCVTHYVAVDCETRDFLRPDGSRLHLLWHGQSCAYRIEGGRATRQTWHTFSRPEEFWPWLYSRLSSRVTTWIVAHNAAYDITALRIWDEMAAGRLRLRRSRRRSKGEQAAGGRAAAPVSVCVTNDPPTVLDLETPDHKRCVVIDTMNWVLRPLSQIAADLGCDVPQLPDDDADDEAWVRKCRLDVTAVRECTVALVEWVRQNDLGNQRYTAAGQGLAALRHGRMDCEIGMGHPDWCKALERESYYPLLCRPHFIGRVERAAVRPFLERHWSSKNVHVEWTAPIHRLDANACYPHLMGQHDFPVNYCTTLTDVPPAQALTALEEYEGCADVLIYSPRIAYPVRCGGKVRMCRGAFRTALCGPDLRDALANGHATAVYRLDLHKRGRPFGSFARLVGSLRQKYPAGLCGTLRSASKMMANALHGKFLQWSGGWELSPESRIADAYSTWVEYDADDGLATTYRMFGVDLQQTAGKREGDDTYPLIGAYTTAYARRLMRRLVSAAMSCEVYYEDADSMHVSDVGYRRLCDAGLVHPTEMGKLKLEKSGDSAQWYGQKCYDIGDERVRAGIAPTAERLEGERYRMRYRLRLSAMLNGRPPAGPVTTDRIVSEPHGTVDGVGRGDGWIDPPSLP